MNCEARVTKSIGRVSGRASSEKPVNIALHAMQAARATILSFFGKLKQPAYTLWKALKIAGLPASAMI
jgi:hypothetical protein